MVSIPAECLNKLRFHRTKGSSLSWGLVFFILRETVSNRLPTSKILGNKQKRTHRRIKPMNQTKQVPMMISLPPEARDKLRIFAAEQNLRNPNQVATAAGIARELVLEGIVKIERMEANFVQTEE
jgi:hypothetical protein